MDLFLLSLLFLALILCISVVLLFPGGSVDKLSNLPPGKTGWPMVGETMEFGLSGPLKFITERTKKYSTEVFRTSLLGEKMVVLCGPAGNKLLFSNENKLVTSWWPKSLLKPLKYPASEGESQEELNSRQQRFNHEILKLESIKTYVQVMDSMTRKHLETEWAPFGEVKVQPLARISTFAIACKLFMNLEDPKRVRELADLFRSVISGSFSVPINFPGTAYYGAMKRGKVLRRELLDIVKQRKREILKEEKAAGAGDLVSRLLSVSAENGLSISEKEMANVIVGLLVANYDTTSTAVTFVIKYLAELPHVYDEVYREQIMIKESKGEGELLSWEDIEKMKYSWNVARETLRILPPAMGAFREAITDMAHNGFTIPKGWKAFWSVHTTHKNPKYFPNPEKFDPSRFEGSGPAPFTFVPFGGGPRMCAGKVYARAEILVLIHNLVTRFKFEKLIPNEKVIGHTSPAPEQGLPLRLLPHPGN